MKLRIVRMRTASIARDNFSSWAHVIFATRRLRARVTRSFSNSCYLFSQFHFSRATKLKFIFQITFFLFYFSSRWITHKSFIDSANSEFGGENLIKRALIRANNNKSVERVFPRLGKLENSLVSLVFPRLIDYRVGWSRRHRGESCSLMSQS